jgi:hypothetical protein
MGVVCVLFKTEITARLVGYASHDHHHQELMAWHDIMVIGAEYNRIAGSGPDSTPSNYASPQTIPVC